MLQPRLDLTFGQDLSELSSGKYNHPQRRGLKTLTWREPQHVAKSNHLTVSLKSNRSHHRHRAYNQLFRSFSLEYSKEPRIAKHFRKASNMKDRGSKHTEKENNLEEKKIVKREGKQNIIITGRYWISDISIQRLYYFKNGKLYLQWHLILICLMQVKNNNYSCYKRYNVLCQNLVGGFPGGAVVGGLPANAGDTGSSPDLGGSHMPRSNWAREPQLLSLRIWSLCSAQERPR